MVNRNVTFIVKYGIFTINCYYFVSIVRCFLVSELKVITFTSIGFYQTYRIKVH